MPTAPQPLAEGRSLGPDCPGTCSGFDGRPRSDLRPSVFTQLKTLAGAPLSRRVSVRRRAASSRLPAPRPRSPQLRTRVCTGDTTAPRLHFTGRHVHRDRPPLNTVPARRLPPSAARPPSATPTRHAADCCFCVAASASSPSTWYWTRWSYHFDEVDQAESYASLLQFQLEEVVENEDFAETAKLNTRNDVVAHVMAEFKCYRGAALPRRVKIDKARWDLLGYLALVDSYMNLQLANTEEYIDGQFSGNLGDIEGSNLDFFL